MNKRQKISRKVLIRAIKDYLSGKCGFTASYEKIGICESYFRCSVRRYKAYGEEAFIKQKHNTVYSQAIKMQMVEEYLTGQASQLEIQVKYGIHSAATLYRWIKEYNSGRGFRRKMSGGSRMKEARSTTVEERIQIAKDCISNGGNYGETALKFNVSYQQVYQWVKKFKEKGNAGLEDRRGKRLKDQTPRTREEELEIEIAKLKHELYMTKMERDVLKKLDEIVRRDAYRK